MPTTDIIGYLWDHRQELEISDVPDLLAFMADLQRIGLEAVRVEDRTIFGSYAGAAVTWPRLPAEEWGELVHAAILSSAVESTARMLHPEDGDEE